MVAKLIITRGLSGSGKTTWAKDFCRWEPKNRFRVNRDDLRGMLYGGYTVASGYELEQLVTKIQHDTIRELLKRDKIVVVDDTNLALKHARALAKLAYEAGAEFEVNDSFLAVSVKEAIARDAGRPPEVRVGAEVIQRQYDRFVKQGLQPVVYTPDYGTVPEPYIPITGKPKCFLVDLDGTMALMGDRNPFDWARVGEDLPNKPIVAIVEALAGQVKQVWDGNEWRPEIALDAVFMSGRDEVCRPQTQKWLEELGFVGHKLFMRPEGDNRKDSVVKLELFNRHIRANYDVRFVLDDRDQVVDMWRSMGLTCLQVAPGDF
jgi:predicted kinase